MSLRVVETFRLSKTGRVDDCEDVLADGEHFTVLADGATDKTGLRFAGRTGGQVAAEVVCAAVAALPAGLPAAAIVAAVNRSYLTRLGSALAGRPAGDLPTASFVAVEKATGRILRVGDTSWRTHARAEIGGKRVDEITAGARAALLHALLSAGTAPAELLADDPGRAMIMPLLRAQANLRNADAGTALAHGGIDGRPVPARFVEQWQLADDENDVVLASDGYPQLCMDRHACEDYLAADLAVDPLRIGTHPGTKGLRPGQVSFDDRSYVRLTR